MANLTWLLVWDAQAEAPELAAIPDKAGQKRRGVLLEVDGNRKSRRSSREVSLMCRV